MDGYYSIDGGAVVRAMVDINWDIINVWSKALMKAREIEYRRFTDDFYYSVKEIRLKQGQRYYTYLLSIVDANKAKFYEILLDLKGFAKIDIRYAAQRMSNRLNTSYRELFEHLKMRILEEKIARVDLALTIKKKTVDVIRHVVNGSYRSLLSRRHITVIGDPDSPEYVRIGTPDNIEVAIYDKHKEMLANSYKLSYKDKLEDYIQRFDGADDVTRIEFRLFRNYLHNVDIMTPDDVNKELISLWCTMLTRYWTPTSRPYDGHNDVATADWWAELPEFAIALKAKTSDNVYNRLRALVSCEYYGKYRMLMDRAEGYIASVVASMAGVPENIDYCLNVVFRRLMKEGDLIHARAKSRFVLT